MTLRLTHGTLKHPLQHNLTHTPMLVLSGLATDHADLPQNVSTWWKKMAPVTHKWIGDQILYGTSFLIFMPFLQIFITFSRQDDDFSNFITCFLFWLWKILDALTSCGEQQLHFCISLPSQKHASPETWRLHCTVNINKKAELIKIVNRLIEGSLFRTFGWGIYLHYSSYGGNNVETTVNSRHWHVRPFSTSI